MAEGTDDDAAVAASVTNQPQQQQSGGGGYSIMKVLGQSLMMMLLFSLAQRFLFGGGGGGGSSGDQKQHFASRFGRDDKLILRAYFSHNEAEANFNSSDLFWEERDLLFNFASVNTREKNITVPCSSELLNNETLFAHIFVTRATSNTQTRFDVIHLSHPLNKHVFRKKEERRNLLSVPEENQGGEIEPELDVYVSCWKPELDVRLVIDTIAPSNQLPPHLHARHENGVFWPVLWVNEFWLFEEHLTPINATTPLLPLSMKFNPISFQRWGLFVQMDTQMRSQMSVQGVMESEFDNLKRILLDTNPYLLGITVIVTILHTIFDFLAFKNDIQFWRNRKSMEGLSVRTLFLSCVCQIIIFLYLMDSGITSWMIIVSSGVGILIEMWKIAKAVKVGVRWKGVLPLLTFTDRHSYAASKTKEYDQMAMKYLSYALYPLVIGYSIYSLVYETHKSWYSWILSSLTGTVYTFGFIMMTPQLFINYKLKSVAHLPWRALIYRSLNTFIDDLFAFVIRMPTLHRIATLRDDVVFLIYIYQRWIYPTDMKRRETLQWDDDTVDWVDKTNGNSAASGEHTKSE